MTISAATWAKPLVLPRDAKPLARLTLPHRLTRSIPRSLTRFFIVLPHETSCQCPGFGRDVAQGQRSEDVARRCAAYPLGARFFARPRNKRWVRGHLR